MNPTEFTINDGWQKFTLSGPAVLQVRQGKVLLAYNEQPEFDRNAYTVTKNFPIRGVTDIFVKTAANNRETSVIVLGDTEESDSGESFSLTPIKDRVKIAMAAGGMPGQVPSAMKSIAGYVVRFSTTLSNTPRSWNDLTINLSQPLVNVVNGVATLITHVSTIDSYLTVNGVSTVTYTIYFSTLPTHITNNAGSLEEVDVWSSSAVTKIQLTIDYYV
ncbi:hypothetical protein [Erwinia sp. OPT-41]|uniref:Bacteriophage protein n=1 Tax=Erwinia plantamica TaxID=3237104 RepID=A0ABW7CLL6_9GAMM